jgi:hypothetical protein
MVSGCGFAVCDEMGAVASISPAATHNKYTCEVYLIIQPFAVLNL